MKQPKPEWYRFCVEEGIKRYLFDHAQGKETIAQVRQKVANIMSDFDTRGERFYPLLFFRLAQYGLSKSQWDVDTQDYMELINDFKKYWDNNPKIRKGKALVEYL